MCIIRQIASDISQKVEKLLLKTHLYSSLVVNVSIK